MSLDLETINEIAIELGIAPAFVEKDWYSVQVLKAISAYSHEAITTIFSGGTSLSKGHDLLQRFSEDLDFRARYDFEEPEKRNKPTRRSFREGIIAAVSEIDGITLDSAKLGTGSNYFKFPLSYTRQFGLPSSMRTELQVEFSFTQPRLAPKDVSIFSFEAQFTDRDAETGILCLSPVETAADKLSALTWRVLKRDRKDKNDDPAMIRHLHDLSALAAVIDNEKALFISTAISSFGEDQQTGKRDTEKGFSESLNEALKTLKNDKLYEEEYSQFVDAMSYADEDDTIDFKVALMSFEKLIAFFEPSTNHSTPALTTNFQVNVPAR